MITKTTGISAYQDALRNFGSVTEKLGTQKASKPSTDTTGFGETLKTSLNKVNEMQAEKKLMIEEFASGKTQNVHELMITMQKAGLAMSMTSTVRNKVMAAYSEIMRMSF
jgi:flagellar hook-basal body complex protein FliE